MFHDKDSFVSRLERLEAKVFPKDEKKPTLPVRQAPATVEVETTTKTDSSVFES